MSAQSTTLRNLNKMHTKLISLALNTLLFTLHLELNRAFEWLTLIFSIWEFRGSSLYAKTSSLDSILKQTAIILMHHSVIL